jgi:hypothetical protein
MSRAKESLLGQACARVGTDVDDLVKACIFDASVLALEEALATAADVLVDECSMLVEQTNSPTVTVDGQEVDLAAQTSCLTSENGCAELVVEATESEEAPTPIASDCGPNHFLAIDGPDVYRCHAEGCYLHTGDGLFEETPSFDTDKVPGYHVKEHGKHGLFTISDKGVKYSNPDGASLYYAWCCECE